MVNRALSKVSLIEASFITRALAGMTQLLFDWLFGTRYVRTFCVLDDTCPFDMDFFHLRARAVHTLYSWAKVKTLLLRNFSDHPHLGIKRCLLNAECNVNFIDNFHRWGWMIYCTVAVLSMIVPDTEHSVHAVYCIFEIILNNNPIKTKTRFL